MGLFFYEPDKKGIEEKELPERESQLLFYIIVGSALVMSTIGLLFVIVE